MAQKCEQLAVYVRPDDGDRCYMPIVGFDATRPWSFYASVRQARGGRLVDVTARALPTGYRVASAPQARAVGRDPEEVRRKYCDSTRACEPAARIQGPCPEACYAPACLPHCATTERME